MLKPHTKSISIVTDQKQPQLSKEQKAFNKLIRQIDAKRANLAAWQEIIPAYQRKYSTELDPLIKTTQDLQIELVHSLDRVSDQKGLTSTERRKIADLISELAAGLAAERDDEDLIKIYNKHSGSDYGEEKAAAVENMKAMFEDMMGVDLGDDLDISSPEKLLQRAQAHMQEQDQADLKAQEERHAKRKKSAKQTAREAQQLADEQQTSQSIRELYRKLASSLHPDREPDPQERERKTVLMQRINQAYDQKNLLLLLELQLQLEHIDQATINSISANRLKHYNKILKEQLIELEHELFHTEDMFKAQFGISPFEPLTPGNVMRSLAADIANIQIDIRELKKDLLVFQDLKKIKAWLKGIRQRPEIDYSDDYF